MIRKGKIAIRIAEMRRAAELEVKTDKDNHRVDERVDGLQSLSLGNIIAADPGSRDIDIPLPELEYVYDIDKTITRLRTKADALGYRRAGIDTIPGFSISYIRH